MRFLPERFRKRVENTRNGVRERTRKRSDSTRQRVLDELKRRNLDERLLTRRNATLLALGAAGAAAAAFMRSRKALAPVQIEKVLIANRGEAALEIIATCKRMGIASVAIYTENDENKLVKDAADEYVKVSAYTDMDAVIEAAGKTGADGIHPAYGFLAENSKFAAAVERAGMTFIGPGADKIAIMGSKLQARAVVHRAHGPVIPGRAIESDEDAPVIAEEAGGYPVMLKASAGGGGKGIRIIRAKDALLSELRSVREEARKAFDDDRIYMEKVVERARHVEVQVARDYHGNSAVLGFRDCSVQRRNQKLVEETCAWIANETRRRMARAAKAIINAIDYHGIGTLEFLVGQDESFYFLEMNTRLQVEHAVTGMTMRVLQSLGYRESEVQRAPGLIELSIRIAEHEDLPINDKNVLHEGHAIEARIYPENPETLFPETGKIKKFDLPMDEYVDVQTAWYKGYEVSIDYQDLTKVIAWGRDREKARNRLARFLSDIEIKGVATNIPLLIEILEHSEFIEDRHHTRWLSDIKEKVA